MLEVYVYNAGKGDCVRVRFGNGHNIFIDTGVSHFSVSFKSICENVLSASESLDLLILTHVDDDHIGGILSLLRMGWKCPFKEVRMNHRGNTEIGNIPLSTRQNNEVVGRLVLQNVTVRSMLAGDTIDIDGAKIIAISPLTIMQSNVHDNIPLAYRNDYGVPLAKLAAKPILKTDSSLNNKNSIVFTFEFKRKYFLFTGDAWAEDIIGGLGEGIHHFDLVKLSHHGAVRNISECFKTHIDCRNFLICTNGVKHPDKQTIAKLASWYGLINIFSPSDWWSRGFFTSDDNINSINLKHKEGLIVGWEA